MNNLIVEKLPFTVASSSRPCSLRVFFQSKSFLGSDFGLAGAGSAGALCAFVAAAGVLEVVLSLLGNDAVTVEVDCGLLTGLTMTGFLTTSSVFSFSVVFHTFSTLQKNRNS